MRTSYEKQPDVQLMRFVDYFARPFSLVNSAQFPLSKILKESTVAKLAEVQGQRNSMSADVGRCSFPKIYQAEGRDLPSQYRSQSVANIETDPGHGK